jgi:hypothetical protein
MFGNNQKKFNLNDKDKEGNWKGLETGNSKMVFEQHKNTFNLFDTKPFLENWETIRQLRNSTVHGGRNSKRKQAEDFMSIIKNLCDTGIFRKLNDLKLSLRE